MEGHMSSQKETSGAGAVTGLAHIGVFAADIDASIRFYTDMLGFECYHRTEFARDGGTIRLAFLRCGSCEVELVAVPGYEKRTAGPVDHIALCVDDIDAMATRLKSKGIVFDTAVPDERPEIFDNGIKCIFFAGPDGERIELNQTL